MKSLDKMLSNDFKKISGDINNVYKNSLQAIVSYSKNKLPIGDYEQLKVAPSIPIPKVKPNARAKSTSLPQIPQSRSKSQLGSSDDFYRRYDGADNSEQSLNLIQGSSQRSS